MAKVFCKNKWPRITDMNRFLAHRLSWVKSVGPFCREAAQFNNMIRATTMHASVLG